MVINFYTCVKQWSNDHGGMGCSSRLLSTEKKFRITVTYNDGNEPLLNIHHPDSGSIKTRTLNAYCKKVIPLSSTIIIKSLYDYLKNMEKQSNYKLEVWPASKIKYAYLKSNYGTGGGTLNNSCMRGKSMQKSLQFYKACGCEIVVVVDSKNKIHARALLWYNVYSHGGKTKKPFNYLDRIYYTKECIKNYYIDYFNTILPAGTYNSFLRTLKKGVVTDSYGAFYIKNIDFTKITHCPYTDTFKYLYWKIGITCGCNLSTCDIRKIINNSKIKKNSNVLLNHLSLSTTSEFGYRRQLDKNSVQEVLSKCWVSKKDCVFVKQYNGYVLKSNIIEIDTLYYSKVDNKVSDTALDGFGLKENIKTDFLTLETMLKQSAVSLPRYKKTELSHKKYVIKIGEHLYHKKDPNIQQYKRKYYTIAQCNKNYKIFEETFCLGSIDEIKIREKTYIAQDKMIPKKFTVIFYNLSWNDEKTHIVYTKHYGLKNDICNSFVLYDGTLVMNTAENKKYVKKYNRKWYPKDFIIKTHKYQLNLFNNKKDKPNEINI